MRCPPAPPPPRTEISAKSGRTLDTVGRALTPDERAAAAQQAQQAQQAANQRMQEQRRDLAMVDSYATEADLRRAYGDRAELLDESIKASVLGLQNLHQSLLNLLTRAADDELSGTRWRGRGNSPCATSTPNC